MQILETAYGSDGRPVGRIVQDSMTGKVTYWSLDRTVSLPKRQWQSVEQLKQALHRLYGPIEP